MSLWWNLLSKTLFPFSYTPNSHSPKGWGKSKKGGMKTKQDHVVPSQVQKPFCVPISFL